MLVITGRNEVVAKVIFLHLSVTFFCSQGGGVASEHAGIPPPWEQTPPPKQTPSELGYHPPPEQTPTYPPPWEQTPPQSRHPPRADPPRPDTPLAADTPPEQTPPPPGSRLQHTVYERPVRILLECILVVNTVYNELNSANVNVRYKQNSLYKNCS